MTKLMEWLFVLCLFTGVWAALVTRQVNWKILDDWMHVIIPLPVIMVVTFGLYAGIVVLWRVFTFNDCEEAAKELQEQIKDAKEDLKKKGITFNSER